MLKCSHSDPHSFMSVGDAEGVDQVFPPRSGMVTGMNVFQNTSRRSALASLEIC